VGEAERLRKTINEFLTFAHPPPCCFAPTDLSRLIEDVLFLARRDSLCDDRVEFSIRIEPELPPVPVDRDRLQQVLWNLVRNSLEAMKGKGCIVIEVARQAQDGIPGILIRVADDGPGIPAEDREQVFEPFFTRKTRGSGLGLALVHAAAKAHGGSIRLREAAPAGCCFDLWLPLAQEAQARGMA
jgi:two-component system sensor histidine kinase HydH